MGTAAYPTRLPRQETEELSFIWYVISQLQSFSHLEAQEVPHNVDNLLGLSEPQIALKLGPPSSYQERTIKANIRTCENFQLILQPNSVSTEATRL